MIDFDLDGLAAVRVIGDTNDVAVVERQLGPIRGNLRREPDIVVEFVDAIPSGPLVFLGRDEWAHDNEGLIVLRGPSKSRVRVRIPLDTLDGCCHIVVERGAVAVPYLVSLMNLRVLANGALALHAAAFELEGRGIVVTGWSKGGKTESLLAGLDLGAKYVGDEWVYLSDGGMRAVGVPEPIRIWDWYLDQLGDTRPQLSVGGRLRVRALEAAVDTAAAVERAGFGPSQRRLAGRVRHLLDRQRHVDVPVPDLIESARHARAATITDIIHSVSADASETTLTRTDGARIAAKMAHSLAFERQPLMTLYHAFRYAFPDRRSALIESAATVERERLHEFFSPHRCWESTHPYPPELSKLGRSLMALGTER